jgi:hypothetical protein
MDQYELAGFHIAPIVERFRDRNEDQRQSGRRNEIHPRWNDRYDIRWKDGVFRIGTVCGTYSAVAETDTITGHHAGYLGADRLNGSGAVMTENEGARAFDIATKLPEENIRRVNGCRL